MDSKRKRILIVDDEVALTKLLKLNLEASGDFIVQVENKGSLAIQTALLFKPDLIFLDIVMPDMEGSEVATLLKSEPQLQNVPVVFLTATVSADEIEHTQGVIGGRKFLAKPASVEQIMECIRQHLK